MFIGEVILRDVEQLDSGSPISRDPSEYLRALNLEADVPDQLTLRERLQNNTSTPHQQEIIPHVLWLWNDTIRVLSKDQTKEPYRSYVTNIMVPVLAKQFEREHDLCPDTRRILLSIASSIPNVLPQDLSNVLQNRSAKE